MISVMKNRLKATCMPSERGGGAVVEDCNRVCRSEVPLVASRPKHSNAVMMDQSYPTSIYDSETRDLEPLDLDRNGSRTENANLRTNLCVVGVTNVEPVSELLQVTAGPSSISSLSPIWKAATSDPTGKRLRQLVDLLLEETSEVVLQLGSLALGKQGEEVVFRVIERVDYSMEEIVDYIVGTPADQCVRLLQASKGELMDLLLRSREREAEWGSESSSGYETECEEGETDDSMDVIQEQQMADTKRGMSSI